MKRKVGLFGLVAIVVMGAMSSPSFVGGGATAEASVLTEPMRDDACVSCVDSPSYCAEGLHDAWDATWDSFTRNGGAHQLLDCRTGTCWTMHGPECDPWVGVPSTDEIEALRLALLNNDAATVARIADARPTTVSLNIERSAVQFTNCTGSVYLHLPASTSLLLDVASRVQGHAGSASK